MRVPCDELEEALHDEAGIGLAWVDTCADDRVLLVFVDRYVVFVIELLGVYLKRCAARLARELVDLRGDCEFGHLEAAQRVAETRLSYESMFRIANWQWQTLLVLLLLKLVHPLRV